MKTKECPICSKDVVSNASLKHYCTLCGMGLEDRGLSVRIRNQIKYYCCNICLSLKSYD